MTDLTLEEYRRFPPEKMEHKIREDAQKAFGLKEISLRPKAGSSSAEMVNTFKALLPLLRPKKPH